MFNARYHCRICNAWMPDTAQARQQHEAGKRHRDNAKDALAKKRAEKQAAEKAERQLKVTLRDIEEKARAAMGGGAGAGPAPGPAPAGPAAAAPERSGDAGGKVRGEERAPAPSAAVEAAAESAPSSYFVRGVEYLEAKHHADAFSQGRRCEVWVEEAEEWANARVVGVAETHVPHSAVSVRRYTLRYPLSRPAVPPAAARVEPLEADLLLVDPERSASVFVEEPRVHPDRMRVRAAVARDEVEVDEATGMGRWETVSVTVLPASAEGSSDGEEDAPPRPREEEAPSLYYRGVYMGEDGAGPPPVAAPAPPAATVKAEKAVFRKRKGGAAARKRKRSAADDN